MAGSTLPDAWSSALSAMAQPDEDRAVVAVPGAVVAADPAGPADVDVDDVDDAEVEVVVGRAEVDKDLADAEVDGAVEAVDDDVGPREEDADEDEASRDDVGSADAAEVPVPGELWSPSPEQPKMRISNAATAARRTGSSWSRSSTVASTASRSVQPVRVRLFRRGADSDDSGASDTSDEPAGRWPSIQWRRHSSS